MEKEKRTSQGKLEEPISEKGNIANPRDVSGTPIYLVPSTGGFESTKQTDSDTDLWDLIKERSINFDTYNKLMDDILRCNPGVLEDKTFYPNDIKLNTGNDVSVDKKLAMNRLPFTSTQAYSLLKFATEKFVKVTVDLNNEEGYFSNAGFSSPYFERVLQKIKDYSASVGTCTTEGLIKAKTKPVLLELIWSYFHEEGMLTQTLHAIAKRFQNIRNGANDPLANLEIDPLRPLNNILWGYIQDAQHRLTVARRVYEYDHHYGIQLAGNSIPNYSPASTRSKFIESFHNLMYRCSTFYKDADDLTRRADGFPVLNALKEVHLLLSEGAHNQFGDLPTTARIEMLMEQWILAQPEVREFLGSRLMIPYQEAWMDRVDTMKTLQGWPQTSVSYYRDLGFFGEQILLSIRLTDWTANNDRDFASTWALFWRDQIQRYLHSYQTVTGVDLTLDSYDQTGSAKATMPGILIMRKFDKERLLKRG